MFAAFAAIPSAFVEISVSLEAMLEAFAAIPSAFVEISVSLEAMLEAFVLAFPSRN